MKPKTHKQLMWALYIEEELSHGHYIHGTRPELYDSRNAARQQRDLDERVVRVEVTVKPVGGRS